MTNDILKKLIEEKLFFKRNNIKTGKQLHTNVNTKEFFIKENLMDLYKEILQKTNFLSNKKTTIRERIYYIENDLTTKQICLYCNKKNLVYQKTKVCLSKTCGDKECNSQHTSLILKQNWETNIRKIKFISVICIGCNTSFLKNEKTKKKYCTQSCWSKHNNRKDSQYTIEKRKQSYKNTISTPDYKEKYKNNPNIKEGYRKLSITMKNKIASGEFTPCITNSWTRWNANIVLRDGSIKKFRSTWDAVFYLLNTNVIYEKIRIPYFLNDEKHIYITDFVDEKNRIIYEIKPNSTKDTEKNKSKFFYAQEWCKENKYNYIIISDEWFHENAKLVDYDVHTMLKKPMEQFL